METTAWQGRVIGFQPRIRLWQSFNERGHSYLGYCLVLEGVIGGERREFSVGTSKAVQAKHAFRGGDEVSGQGVAAQYTPDVKRPLCGGPARHESLWLGICSAV
jgi:hypothetical protein